MRPRKNRIVFYSPATGSSLASLIDFLIDFLPLLGLGGFDTVSRTPSSSVVSTAAPDFLRTGELETLLDRDLRDLTGDGFFDFPSKISSNVFLCVGLNILLKSCELSVIPKIRLNHTLLGPVHEIVFAVDACPDFLRH